MFFPFEKLMLKSVFVCKGHFDDVRYDVIST